MPHMDNPIGRDGFNAPKGAPRVPENVARHWFDSRITDHGLDLVSSLLMVEAMDSPLRTHAASFAAAVGVSMTEICLPPASARAWRLRAW